MFNVYKRDVRMKLCIIHIYIFGLSLQTNKPLIEKRRRERINKSLLQLKNLVLRGTNKQVCLKYYSDAKMF